MKSASAYRNRVERTSLSSLEYDDDRDYAVLPIGYYKGKSYILFFEAERKLLDREYDGGEIKLFLYEAYNPRNTMEAKGIFSVEPRREIYSGKYKTVKGLMQTLNKVDAINWNTPVNYDPFHFIKKHDLLVVVSKDGKSLTNFANYGRTDSDEQVTFAFSYYGNCCWGKQIYRNATEASLLDELYQIWYKQELSGGKSHWELVEQAHKLLYTRAPSSIIKELLKDKQ